jgi:hypothetical protein
MEKWETRTKYKSGNFKERNCLGDSQVDGSTEDMNMSVWVGNCMGIEASCSELLSAPHEAKDSLTTQESILFSWKAQHYGVWSVTDNFVWREDVIAYCRTPRSRARLEK